MAEEHNEKNVKVAHKAKAESAAKKEKATMAAKKLAKKQSDKQQPQESAAIHADQDLEAKIAATEKLAKKVKHRPALAKMRAVTPENAVSTFAPTLCPKNPKWCETCFRAGLNVAEGKSRNQMTALAGLLAEELGGALKGPAMGWHKRTRGKSAASTQAITGGQESSPLDLVKELRRTLKGGSATKVKRVSNLVELGGSIESSIPESTTGHLLSYVALLLKCACCIVRLLHSVLPKWTGKKHTRKFKAAKVTSKLSVN